MIDIRLIDYTTFIAFWISFSRWVSFLLLIPLFDEQGIPLQLKILMAIVLSYVFFPYTQNSLLKDIEFVGQNHFWILTIGHTLIGLIMGMLVKFIMNIAVASGSLISQSIGLSAIRYFDPTFTQAVGPFEKLIKWVITLALLSAGAHVALFKGIYISFYKINLRSFFNINELTPVVLEITKSIFSVALILASPIIFTNFLQMIVLGIMARAVPQLNVLMVSFVINIGIGLATFLIVVDEFNIISTKSYIDILSIWYKFITG